MREIRPRNRGAALIILLVFIAVTLAYSAATMRETSSHLRGGVRYEQGLRADYAAQSGLQLALAQLHHDDSWGSGSLPFSTTFSIPDSSDLEADVKVWNNFAGTSPITADDGTTVPPGRVYLETSGVVNGESFGTDFGHARSILVKPQPFFEFGLFEFSSIVIRRLDTWIDSYDSDDAATDHPADWEGFPSQYQPDRPTSVHRNAEARTRDATELEGAIYGSLSRPGEFPPDIFTGGEITGGDVVDDSHQVPYIFKKPAEMEPLPLGNPNTLLPNIPAGHYGPLVVPPNTTVTLERGEYFFQRIEFGPGSEVQVAGGPGAAVLYVDQGIVFGEDCIVNMRNSQPNPPKAFDLQIYGTDGPDAAETSFEMYNGVRFKGVLAGHNSKLNTYDLTGDNIAPPLNTPTPAGRKGVDIYGAIYLQATVLRDGARVHHDLALKNRMGLGETQWILLSAGSKQL